MTSIREKLFVWAPTEGRTKHGQCPSVYRDKDINNTTLPTDIPAIVFRSDVYSKTNSITFSELIDSQITRREREVYYAISWSAYELACTVQHPRRPPSSPFSSKRGLIETTTCVFSVGILFAVWRLAATADYEIFPRFIALLCVKIGLLFFAY